MIYSNSPQNCIPLNTKIVIGNVKNFFSHSDDTKISFSPRMG